MCVYIKIKILVKRQHLFRLTGLELLLASRRPYFALIFLLPPAAPNFVLYAFLEALGLTGFQIIHFLAPRRNRTLTKLTCALEVR